MTYSKILSLLSGIPTTVDYSLTSNALGVSNLQLLGSTSGYIQFQAKPTTTSYTVVWPAAQAASSGYALINDGSGNLSWAAAASPLTFAHSLVNTAGTVTLVNDSTPTASQYYGTNGSSVLGYYNLPTGFTNPMTTLGDIIYENATPAPARLAGNTTTATQFLSQTGTGSVSTAPSWTTAIPVANGGTGNTSGGMIGSNWTAYTPTFTAFGTVTGVGMFWRRVGDSLDIQGSFVTGTPTATSMAITLPSGLVTASTSKFPASNGIVGYLQRPVAFTTSWGQLTVIASNGFVNVGVLSSATNAQAAANGSGSVGTGEGIFVNITGIPISGWNWNS